MVKRKNTTSVYDRYPPLKMEKLSHSTTLSESDDEAEGVAKDALPPLSPDLFAPYEEDSQRIPPSGQCTMLVANLKEESQEKSQEESDREFSSPEDSQRIPPSGQLPNPDNHPQRVDLHLGLSPIEDSIEHNTPFDIIELGDSPS